MLNGLDLFSGIGGISLALEPWVKPIAYCENDKYAQSVLLSRMSKGDLHTAPIWDDIRTLGMGVFPSSLSIDIIYGGFPCQDISVAGTGKGLDGEQSSLFFEVARLIKEIEPAFVFLENVPAIRTRGGERVVKELASLGYDCRWDTLSAFDVGAPHKRERWFLLAHAISTVGRAVNPAQCQMGKQNNRISIQQSESSSRTSVSGPKGIERFSAKSTVENAERNGLEESRYAGIQRGSANTITDPSWWATEPNVGRVANGVPFRMDRIRGLGNAVVPLQAREAFQRLIGLDTLNKGEE